MYVGIIMNWHFDQDVILDVTQDGQMDWILHEDTKSDKTHGALSLVLCMVLYLNVTFITYTTTKAIGEHRLPSRLYIHAE